MGFLSAIAWWVTNASAGVTLVPMPPLVADGHTTGFVRLWVDEAVRPKVKVPSGELGPVVLLAGGWVVVPYTPAAAARAGTMPFLVTVGGVDTVLQVPVVPPSGMGALTVSFDPPVVQGGTPSVVRVAATDPSPIPPEQREILLTVSVGELSPPVSDGSGWVATYTPPKKVTGPTLAVLAAVDAAAPAVRGHALLPILHRDKVTFPVAAGTANVLHLGGQQYGPVVASPAGQVSFEVERDVRLPAGYIVTVATDGTRTEKAVILPRAPKAIVSWLGLPPAVRGDGPAVDLPLLVIGANGLPKDDALIVTTASGGTFGSPRWSDGVYAVPWTPPTVPGDVWLTAEVDGVRTERKVRVVAGSPGISPAGETPGPRDNATRTVPVAAWNEHDDGTYRTTVSIDPTSSSSRLAAAPPVFASGLAPARLIVWPDSPLAAVGAEIPVSILAVDALGVPVPNVELSLSVTLGDGTVPATARTDVRGGATVSFAGGHAPGLRGIRVTGAGLTAEAPIVMVPGAVDPSAGESAGAGLRGAYPVTTIPRGAPASVHVATVPVFAAAGRAMVVVVQVADANGRGVTGLALEVPESPGTVGSVSEQGHGVYTFTIAPVGEGPLDLELVASTATRTARVPDGPRPQRSRAIRSDGRAVSDFGLALTNTHGVFTQGGTLGDDLLGNVGYGTPLVGFVGIRGDAVVTPVAGPWGALALDARVIGRAELVQVADAKLERLPVEVNAGIRYTYKIGAVRLGVTGGVHRYNNTLLHYRDEARDVPGFLVLPAFGARVGPLVTVTTGALTLDLEVARTFVSRGSHHVESVLQQALSEHAALRVGASWDGRSWNYVTTDGEGTATARQDQILLFLGAGFRY